MDYLDRMHSASTRMRKLIDDLPTFSKATRDHQRFAKVDLRDIINKILKDLDYQIELKQALINVNVSGTVDGLSAQLQQLFLNLLGNSLKFTQEGMTPKITVRSVTLNGQHLNYQEAVKGVPYCVIEIIDNGIGFDTSDSVRIFDIFQRLTPRSEFEGTGIGLALCQKIAENHSGFISATGKPEAGATFTIALPLKSAQISS